MALLRLDSSMPVAQKLPRSCEHDFETPGIAPPKLKDYLKIARFADCAGFFRACFGFNK